MRILRVIYDWPPPWQGLAAHPYELTAAQLELGHEFTVFCGRWPSAGPIEQFPKVQIKTFFREPIPGTISITSSIALFFYYLSWRKSNTVDIIHCHGHFAIWIYLYRLFLSKFFKNASELKVPLVAHFHNTVAGREAAMKAKGVKIKPHSKYLSWPLAKLADKWAVRTAAACIFVSNATKEEAVKYCKMDSRHAFVVESGVNMALFSPVGVEEWEKTRRELGLDTLDKVVLNHGSMLERKNIHLLVEALAHLPVPYKLLLVGPGDDKYLVRLREIAQELKVLDRIVFVGYTPYPQVPIAFQAADIFVLPSSWEGVPKVVMQSLACGVPALVSGFKLSEDISGLYYLNDLSPKRIAEDILRITATEIPVDFAKLRKLYSWKTKALEVARIYEAVLTHVS